MSENRGMILLAVLCRKDGFFIVYLEGFLLKSQSQGPVQCSNGRPLAAWRLPHTHSEHQTRGDGWAVKAAPEQTMRSLDGGGVLERTSKELSVVSETRVRKEGPKHSLWPIV